MAPELQPVTVSPMPTWTQSHRLRCGGGGERRARMCCSPSAESFELWLAAAIDRRERPIRC